MQSALLTNFKVLLALLFRDIVHQISKLIFYVTHISASFPTSSEGYQRSMSRRLQQKSWVGLQTAS